MQYSARQDFELNKRGTESGKRESGDDRELRRSGANESQQALSQRLGPQAATNVDEVQRTGFKHRDGSTTRGSNRWVDCKPALVPG